MKIRYAIASALLLAVIPLQPTKAHNVWCHCNFKSEKDTITFFHLAGEVYASHAKAVKMWHDSNTPLETGVLTEFEYKLDSTKAIRPDYFRENMRLLQALQTQLGVLDGNLANVIAFLEKNPALPVFDQSLSKIMLETSDLRRLDARVARYGEIGSRRKARPQGPPLRTVLDIYRAQRNDLGLLRGKLDEVIAAARDAIPLAEKGQFAQVMLSGRNGFGDKMPQFTDWFSAYDRFYVQSCMSTIAATMQIYPKGFEWLKKR